MMPDMDRKNASKVLVVLSMIFGISLALMAYFGSAALATVAIVGGVILGLLWTMTALFGRAAPAAGSSGEAHGS